MRESALEKQNVVRRVSLSSDCQMLRERNVKIKLLSRLIIYKIIGLMCTKKIAKQTYFRKNVPLSRVQYHLSFIRETNGLEEKMADGLRTRRKLN